MSIRMGFGVAGFPYSSVKAFLAWVDLLEERGVDSLWFSERLVGGAPSLEPMTAMALVAGRTERIKFGMNAVVLPLRDPLVIAKECATLDFLSGGRLLPVFGVGGDAIPEWRATGREAEGRGPRADEMLRIMARLWSEDRVNFEGKYYHYADATITPKPVQQPLPLWIGGSSPAAVRRTAQVGTGWLGGLQTPKQVAPVTAAIRKASAEAGRPLDPDHYGAGFTFRFGSWEEPAVERGAKAFSRVAPGMDVRDYMAVGGAAEIVARAQEYVSAGISKFVVRPVADDDDELMDQTRRLIEEVLPAVEAM